MDTPSPFDEDALLREAKAKAEKLIADLISQRDNLDRFAPRLAPEKFVRGQAAFASAIESTRRTLEGIEQALRHAD
jgi:uncharacterized protein YukE